MKIDIYNTDKKYDIIYADPPWEYPLSGGIKNSRGMAKQHYATMCVDEIGELPIKRLCTPTAVCFLWATFPNIENAIHTISEWGFIYKTAGFVWVKKNKCGSNFLGDGAIHKGKRGSVFVRRFKKDKSKRTSEVPQNTSDR